MEVINTELDQQLRFYIDKYQTNWSIYLPAIDFTYNIAWYSSLGMPPLRVLLGTDL